MRVTVVFIILLLSIVGSAATSRAGSAGGNLTGRLEDSDEIMAHVPQGTFVPSWSADYFRFKANLLEDYGLTYLIFPALILQQGTQGGGDDFTMNEQVHVVTAWEPFRELFPGGNLIACTRTCAMI